MLVKLEYMNPGGSIKDRIGLPMVEEAERTGKLKKGGTIVEPTSGNTGVALSMAAAIKGYKTVFVMPDKMSEEKRNLLRAYGAKVIVTPTAVAPEDPRSYYKMSDTYAAKPGGFKPNQYENPENPRAHYMSTGPEIWEQTEGKITHLVVGAGTGGTISGAGKYLKEKNPNIQVIAVDPEGSVYNEYFKTKTIPKLFKTYKVEGVGEDFLPGTIDFSVIDDVVTVGDKESFLTARQLAREEGILVGGSSGLALAGAIHVAESIKDGLVVVILPDSGKSYLTKFYNDEWMRDYGFLDETEESVTPLLQKNLHFITVESSATPQEAIRIMKHHSISQVPVVEGNTVVGTVTEAILTMKLFGQEKIPVTVAEIMDTDVLELPEQASIHQLAQALSKKEMVIIVNNDGTPVDVLTRIDLLTHLTTL